MSTPEPHTGRSKLNADLKHSSANLGSVAIDLAQGASMAKAASNLMQGALFDKLLGPTALFAGGLVGVLKTVRSIVRESGILSRGIKEWANVQTITGKFQTLLGSITAAKKRVEELYRFTAKSAFEFKDVAEASRLLQALTRGAYSGTKALELVGDMAAATGANIAETAERIGKLHNALASGRGLDKIIFQLQFSGVVTEELAAKLESLEASGASFSSKWSEVEKVIRRTEGGMKNQVETLDALTTRLDNANGVMAKAFGEPYIEAQTKALKIMIASTENLTPLIAEIGRDFALLPNFIRQTKNTLLETTVASERFASALRLAYRVGVSLFAGLSGAAATLAARNLMLLGQAGLTTATALRTTYAATLAQATAQTGLTAATALSTSASEAFTKGNVFSSIALKAESVWLGIKTRALALNAASARLAGAGTAAYTIRAHAANLATGALAAAVALARKGFTALIGVVRGASVAFLSNPWTAAAAAILTVAVALYKWGSAAREAAKSARNLSDSIADTTKRLNAQSAAVKSLTDWQTHVEKLRQRYAELTAEVVEFNRKAQRGEPVTREDADANNQAVAEWKQTRAALSKELRRDTRKLDLTDREKDFIREDQAGKRAGKDRDFQLSLAAAETPEARLALLASRREELEQRTKAGRIAKEGELKNIRGGYAAERTRLELKRDEVVSRYDQQEQTIKDRRDSAMEAAGAKRNAQGSWSGVPVSAEARDIFTESEKELRKLKARRSVEVDTAERNVNSMALSSPSLVVQAQGRLDEAVRDGADPQKVEALTRALEDARAAVSGLTDAENELAGLKAQEAQESRDVVRTRAAENTTNEYDARINSARRAGMPTAGLEFEKAKALAEVEKSQALTPQDAMAAQNKLDALEAARASGQIDATTERRKNAALIGRDRKGAQAIQDTTDLRALIDKYAGLGLSKETAMEDYQNNLRAEAANRPASIVASSIQAIGGGGGFAASDPVLATQQRIERLNGESVSLLKAIEAKIEGGGIQ